MPFGGGSLECRNCRGNSSAIWRKDGPNEFICHSCFVEQELLKKEAGEESNGNGNKNKRNQRQSRGNNVRLKSTRTKVIAKGKSRRNVFKTKFFKVGISGSSNSISDNIFHKGQYLQCGDIVSVVDTDDKQKYYAQCTGFMTDQYCRKSVCYAWLLPTSNYDPDEPFDPSAFYLGPGEDFCHDIESIEFVCHAPSDYYKPLNSLYPTFPSNASKNYVSMNVVHSLV